MRKRFHASAEIVFIHAVKIGDEEIEQGLLFLCEDIAVEGGTWRRFYCRGFGDRDVSCADEAVYDFAKSFGDYTFSLGETVGITGDGHPVPVAMVVVESEQSIAQLSEVEAGLSRSSECQNSLPVFRQADGRRCCQCYMQIVPRLAAQGLLSWVACPLVLEMYAADRRP